MGKSKEAEVLFKLVLERYERLLAPEELEEVRKGVEIIVELSDALRSVRLKNSDEPFSVFIPYKRRK
jgi:hypothetical protein